MLEFSYSKNVITIIFSFIFSIGVTSHTLLILEPFSLLAIRFYFGHRSIRVILSKIEPFHQCFISMGFFGFIRHLLISHKFYLLADTTLGYFFHVLKIKLSK